MRFNLSSQIALTQIDERLYKPTNAFEQSVLTEYEKIPTHLYAEAKEAAQIVARGIALDIKAKQAANEQYTLAIAAGNSPQLVLDELIHLHKDEGLSFKNVQLITVYEFYPLDSETSGCLAHLKQDFLAHVDIPDSQVHAFDSKVATDKLEEYFSQFDKLVQSFGPLDLVLLGIGRAGTIGANTPGSGVTSDTRLQILDQATLQESVRSFNSKDNIPSAAMTLGMSTILNAKKVIVLAWGENKAEVLRKGVEETATDMVPVSLLQNHKNVQIYADLQAGSQLTRILHPWLVTSCEWNSKLIRRAIVWLCELTGKPILKLTNKDYSEHHLGQLITKFGSAYDVNIRVFNDIQHTITGWPGGKPNADDTYRPERKDPNPKRVLIFSPHPDDDVISMGGTFRRLVTQGHEVHVAYQTSGNIAVGDEELVRYLSYLRNVCEHLGMEDSEIMKHALKLRKFIMEEKEEGSIETPEARFMKGTIRREEARTACRFVGVKEENVHFLDLPFYETGAIKKGDLSERDANIIIDLLHEIKPHQIFVAGDLADPHGTHKVCLDAALAAIDVVKKEDWFKDCWIWMYRGAWAEWDIDDIEMAVPMSPEELRFKRNSILKHQSQMEAAPFLGDDERLFWQRAEDRNKATAELYWKLGLASYEAIEAFVRYHPID